MDARATSEMHVIKREDKQSVVRNFIAQALEARRKNADAEYGSEGVKIFLVARSPESPVARAVAELADEIAASGLSVDAVFAHVDGPLTRPASPCPASNANQTRLLRDARLLDAHEVLVIGNRASWVGDCMRRDPAMCDAYERYSTDCALSLVSARGAFEQLWAGAQATRSAWMTSASAPAPAPQSENDLLASTAFSAFEENAFQTPATRH